MTPKKRNRMSFLRKPFDWFSGRPNELLAGRGFE
jgi:hypothetical protein